MANVIETLKNWDENQWREWYAIDELKQDGTMLRLTVDTLEDVRTRLDSMIFGRVDYSGADAVGVFDDEPFYRVCYISPDAARVFFEACADEATPEDAGRLYTVTEAAARLKRTRQAVQDLIKRGRLHAEFVLGEWRIMGYELHRFTPYHY